MEKELKYKQLPNGLYALSWEGGGELPKELSGNFTNIHMINRVVDGYYRKMKKVVKEATKKE